jgi:hypothetical protein
MPSIPVTINGVLSWEGHNQGPVDPGYGQGGGFRPDNSLPGGGYPSQGLPGRPVRPDNGLPVGPPGSIGTLPVFPWDPTDPGYGVGRPDRPDQGLPGSGGRPDNSLPGERPNRPDNSLPGSGGRPDNSLPPTAIRPGLKLVVKYLACVGLILVPDNSLPGGAPETPDQELPETPAPK